MKKHSRLGILLLLVAVLGWFAVVRPQITKFSEQALAAKVKSEEVKSYNQRLADLRVIKDQGEVVQKTLRSMYLAMPRASQIPEVLIMIESIGNNSGVVFSGVTVGTPTGPSIETAATLGEAEATTEIAEVPVSISFTGNLDSTNKFLDAVQNNIRTAIVKNQAITSDKTGNMAVTMQLGLVYQGGAQ